MSIATLTLTAVLALASDPKCGGAQPGSEMAERYAAIAMYESGGNPLAIGVNGPGGGARKFDNPGEAVAFAKAMIAAGRSIDLGLMQINSAHLAGHGLTVETALDACRNMAAGAEHYSADVRAVLEQAHRRYNTGGTERGAAYAAAVEATLGRIRMQAGTAASVPQPGPLGGGAPVLVQALPPAPAPWDVYGRATVTHPQRAASYTPERPVQITRVLRADASNPRSP